MVFPMEGVRHRPFANKENPGAFGSGVPFSKREVEKRKKEKHNRKDCGCGSATFLVYKIKEKNEQIMSYSKTICNNSGKVRT